MIALVAALALSSPVEDFFPLQTGTRWTYSDSDGGSQVDEVLRPVDVGGGVEAFRVASTMNGIASGALLYQVAGDTVKEVGYDPGKPRSVLELYKDARPILRIGEGKLDWSYLTEMPTSMGPVLVQVRGWSAKSGKKKILDREVDTYRAEVTAKIGNDKSGVEVKQVMTYGKGFGLVELQKTTKASGKTLKSTMKLTAFTRGTAD